MLENEAIREILPHRYPMLLVDKVLELVCRQRCVGIKEVTGNEWLVDIGGRKIFPNTLVIEAMAQIGGMPMHTPETPAALMVGLEAFEFDGFVGPGDTIRIEGQILWQRAKLFKASVEACTGSGFQARGTILYASLTLDDSRAEVPK
jgi:3-hydroxyacyl-[acyl-carrier-protein] dehydratase